MSDVKTAGFEEASCEYKNKSGKIQTVHYLRRVNYLHPKTGVVYPAHEMMPEQRKVAATGVLLNMAGADGRQATVPDRPDIVFL